MIRVHDLTEDEWQDLRDVRLRALRQDPDAFGSTLEREESFREQHWRMRARSSPWFVARANPGAVQDPALGLAGFINEPGASAEARHLVALWVDPAARRAGAGAALLEAVAAAAVRDGARVLTLWVLESNLGAIALYERSGFVATGARQGLPRDPGMVEARYERSLAAG